MTSSTKNSGRLFCGKENQECITQDKPLTCDFKIRKVKSTRKKFLSSRKIWKLHEDNVRSVEGYWSALKGVLLEAADRGCGLTKGSARRTCLPTCCWGDDVSNSVSEKRKLWKEWKQENTSTGKCLEAKKKARRIVYQAKYEAERKVLGNMGMNDQR